MPRPRLGTATAIVASAEGEKAVAMTTDAKLPPTYHDEREAVGSILRCDEKAGPIVMGILAENDITDPQLRATYSAMIRFRDDCHRIDLTPLVSVLQSAPAFVGCDVVHYLTELLIGTSVHAEYHAGQVKEVSRKRRLAQLGESVRDGALNGQTSEEILNNLLSDVDDLRRDTNNAPKLTTVSDIVSVQIEWAWHGFFPRGMLTLIDGDPEKGKSQITCAIAACWTTKKPFPFALADEKCVLGNVLMVATEDNADSVQRPRLEAAGANLKRVFLWPEDAEPVVLPNGIDRLRAAIVEHDISLLILDPIGAYFAEDINTNRDADVRRALRPLVSLAQELGLTVLAVRHLNKDSSKSAMYRGGGSIGFIAAARVVWAVGLDPNDSSRHVLAVLKSNIGPKPPSLFYRIESWETTSRIHWQGESTYTASDIIVTTHRNPKKRSEAESIIGELLANGPKLERDVWAACEAKGIGTWSYKNARKQLGVVASKRGLSGWLLSLPEEVGEGEEVGEEC